MTRTRDKLVQEHQLGHDIKFHVYVQQIYVFVQLKIKKRKGDQNKLQLIKIKTQHKI